MHAGLVTILADSSAVTAGQRRQIVATIEFPVNPTDAGQPDLTTPGGFHDDLPELHRLHGVLGYV